MKTLPPQEALKKLLRYDPKSGKVTWRARDGEFMSLAQAAWWNRQYAGKEAFTARTSGYLHGTILGAHYRAHRVIWKLVTGEEPDFIDHQNGVRDDNRWANLRSVPKVENEKNTKLRGDNASGTVGVCYIKPDRKWRAQIFVSGKCHYLGQFTDLETAIRVRAEAEVKFRFHKNHGRKTT